MKPQVKRVAAQQIRDQFNAMALVDRAEAGELLIVLERAGPAHPKANQPPGTISRTMWYVEVVDGQLVKVALVHEYIRPDGTRGGSGLPDPKRLVVGGEIWIC